MRILEEYVLNFWGVIRTVRLYTNGEYRCSCQHFHKSWQVCYHVQAVKNHDKVALIGARRTK